jgi:TrmH family RNA methyltransferase
MRAIDQQARLGLERKRQISSLEQPGGAGDQLPADVITSRDNQWLKMFRAALRGNGPERNHAIGVEGTKLVEDGLRSGLETEALLVSDTGEHNLGRILQAASESEAGIPRERILRTTDKLFAGIAGTETPQGVAALFRPPVWELDDVLRGAGPSRGGATLVVVLAGAQDPGNVGTILRSAEAFGATGAITTRGTADPWSPKALRASAGSALRLPVLRGMAIPVLLAQLKTVQVRVVAAIAGNRPGAPRVPSGLTTWDSPRGQDALREAVAIFIGNEGTGLPAEVEHAADATISIPMSGMVDSLNAGVAASLLLYELARQREGKS